MTKAEECDTIDIVKLVGVVKKFDDTRGYGFIGTDSLPADVFVHQSSILMRGYRKLVPGQRVEFNAVKSQKGYLAQKVIILAWH